MPSISLTTFADFVTATGTARITKTRAAKKHYSQDYSPAMDFYKPLRDRVEACLAKGWDANDLLDSLKEVEDPKKLDGYEKCRDGLTTWVGRKTIVVRPAVRDVWSSGDLDVVVNPELHADVNGSPHLIKLHFKTDVLSKQKAELILHLLANYAPAGTTVGVLDVRRSKLIVPTREIDGLDALLEAEAAALIKLWNAL